jgi:hypothetical protein
MVPVKTAEGQAELGTRRLRLSQRHRTVLFLVDGKRSEAQIRALALQAGAPPGCFDELVARSLIALPDGSPAKAVARVEPARATPASAEPIEPVAGPAPSTVESPPAAPARPAAPATLTAPTASRRGAAVPSAPIPLVVVNDSLLPAVGTLPPDSSALDSVRAGPPPPDSWLPPESDEEEEQDSVDAVFVQARDLLQRAVRTEAPWAGSLTLLRLRRSRTRGDLDELLDEVEARISRPHRSLASAQLLTSVRQLLATGLDTSRSAA